MWQFILFVLILLLAVHAYRQYTRWERSPIPHEKPSFPYGCLKPLVKKQRSFGLIIYDAYLRSTEKLMGIYFFFQPTLFIRDAELARRIMTTDFSFFHDRGSSGVIEDIFSMRGQKWRTLRAKLAPSFTSGKLKGMFGTINDVGDKMVAYINGQLGEEASKSLEMKNILTTYAIDIVGSVIFGLDVDSFINPDNEFRKVNTDVFLHSSIIEDIFNACAFIYPPITKLMAFLGYKDRIFESLKGIVQRTIEMREEKNIVRKDLLQLLIQLRNTGKISEDDKNWDIETAADNFKSMSIDTIAAQAFIFYLAGSETTAATSSYTIYELAMYPDLLKKAQDEVDQCLEKHGLKPNDKLTYEAIMDMKFLDLCIMETTRKYPGLPFLNRECTQDYQVPDTDYTIKKGTPVLISLFGLHRDPEHFPNPTQYDPERFTEENHNYNPIAYMPFGEGPRHCIALRMGKLNSKVALVKILANFNIVPMERKEVEFMFDPAPVLLPKDGLHVRLTKRH